MEAIKKNKKEIIVLKHTMTKIKIQHVAQQ